MPIKKRIIVLDTSAFIAGYDPLSVEDEQCSVPMIEKELVPNTLPWFRFNSAVENGKLKLKAPGDCYLEKVRECSKRIGDARVLSEVDLQVLALSLEKKDEDFDSLLITDDYSIQNVANAIGVNFASLLTFGIRFLIQWVLYCPACHRKYSSDYKSRSCKFCGTELKRKPLRKKSVEKSAEE